VTEIMPQPVLTGMHWSYLDGTVLSDVHQAYLNDAAIADRVIVTVGIRSEGGVLVFPWQDGDQRTLQRRQWPDDPAVNGSGPKSAKYLWEKDRPLHLWAIRPVTAETKTVLIIEGTKQALAVASWAPPEYAIYAMAGCDGWVSADLARFAGLRVIIMTDKDAGSNPEVYEAAEALGAKLELLDAEPRFVPSPGRAKDGIDDFLAGIAPEQRPGVLVNLLAKADEKDAGRPAARRPPRKTGRPDSGNRPPVQVNRDRFEVICEITNILQAKFNGTSLFCYGGALTMLLGAATEPLDRDSFARWLALGVATHKLTDKGYEACWPDPQTMGALLAGGSGFAQLDRVSHTPFIRENGSVCTVPGYDPASCTWLVPLDDPDGKPLLWPDVPEFPSREQAAQAARRLLGPEWLGDMPFRDEASRANALALVLTPFIRGLVPLVPLAVVSGLQPGVGKGLLGDCLSLMLTGEAVPPLAWLPDEDDENRKQILSAFRDGTPLIWFDEAHEIESHALSRAITSLTYADRILGVSKIARYPNRVTWLATGNQVRVSADMARRAYFIELWPAGPDPQDRPATDFRHPELRDWTVASRSGLVTDALTIIRAWWAAGCPPHDRGMSMGSFERWDAMMSGILDWAGVPGFLDNLAAKRSERDTTGGYWSDHLDWLAETFPGRAFTILDIKAAATASGGTWDAPPGFGEPDVKGWTQRLGTTYSHHTDRYYGHRRLVKVGTTTGTKGTWRVEDMPLHLLHPEGELLPDQEEKGSDEVPDEVFRGNSLDEVDEVDEVVALPAYAHPPVHARAGTHTREARETSSASSTSSMPAAGFTLGFDLETADAGQLFRGGHDGPFIRLAAVIGPPGIPRLMAADRLPAALARAQAWYGHNILGFDGLALALMSADPRATWDWFCSGARDTELVARQYWPPRSREKGHSEDKYGLDAVAVLLGIAGKSADLKAIARKHGGYDRIPLDDPEYVSYLLDGDMPATRGVAAALLPYYDSDPYLPREHQLARIAGHMRLNGLLVDRELLEQRYAAGEARKRRAAQVLHDGWGLPLGRTVMRGRGKAKAEAYEEFTSPLSTEEGRAWLAQMWQRYQVPSPPRTKTGKLAIGAEDLKRAAADPACPPDLRAMIMAMNVVITTRTVYQTARAWLCPDGRVHPSISFRQASGRWSVTEPGLTVFGKHEGRHVERDIYIAAPGCSLWSFDLSQVDMRAIAGHCQDPAYAAMFVPGRDAHDETAALVFGEAARDGNGHHPMRQAAKEYGHGWNYGLGPKRMIERGNPPDQVYAYVNGMEARFPVLCEWREGIRSRARDGGVLDNGFGRRMRCDPQYAYTVAPALMGQGGARDILGDCMLRLDPALYRYLLLQVHDELIFELPDADAGEAVPAIRAAMTGSFRGVPILCEQAGPGRNWGEISAKG